MATDWAGPDLLTARGASIRAIHIQALLPLGVGNLDRKLAAALQAGVIDRHLRGYDSYI
jgi:hypothetical protein